MLFNSIQFIIFLPITFLVVFSTPAKYRWIPMLIASYYFYMSWKAEYALLLAFSTIVTYIAGRYIGTHEDPKVRKTWLTIGIIVNMGFLFTFKYANFFSATVTNIVHEFGINMQPWVLNVLLPIGISFYTFQAVSYLIDVYNKKTEPERHLGIFALYKSFFPQLVAGPIERAPHMLPQLRAPAKTDFEKVISGLRLMLWGFFKKLVIADRIALFIVNPIYNDPAHATSLQLLLATLLFGYQIYCDFSGYTDIARGTARMFGYELVINFNRPFSSKSIAEFWRRWHISLSSWFADYVFNPFYLALSRSAVKLHGVVRHWYAFIVSILIGEIALGLWHGANWTFAMFGLWHGIMILVYYALRKWWDKVSAWILVPFTYILVSIGFIFFRANSLSDIITIISRMSGQGWSIGRIPLFDLAITFGMILILELVQYLWKESEPLTMPAAVSKPLIRNAGTATLIVLILLGIAVLGVFESVTFIYFQF